MPIALAQIAACDDICSNKTVATFPSPDDKLKAVVFNRDCGATTGFSSQISVLDSKQAPSGTGNVFVADASQGTIALGAWGGPNVEVRWTSPNDLLVRYAAGAKVFKEERAMSGVTITYKVGDIP